MKKVYALTLTLVKQYLKEFIPGPLQSEFDDDLAKATQEIAGDEKLKNWLSQKITQIEIWQSLLESPKLDEKILREISTALFEEKQLKIKYRRGDKATDYTVHPLGLVKRDQVVYLIATFYNFDDPRFLSIHRIEAAKSQSEPRRSLAFNLAEYLSNGLPFEFKKDHCAVELLFRDSVYDALYDRLPRGATAHSYEDGWFKVTGHVPNTMELRWWLLGFNDAVRILNPPELAVELQNMLFDPLTGLLLRKATTEHLYRLLAASQRTGKTMALAIVDIDHFKDVNDKFGHENGDRVLKEVAGRLKKSCREMDVMGRWGGEEFLVILPDLPSEAEALQAVERLRNVVKSLPIAIQFAGGPPFSWLSVTVSIGVRCIQRAELDVGIQGNYEEYKDRLFSEADQALFQAKANGRDQVCKWGK